MIKVERYTAPWCGPCKFLIPVFNRLRIRYAPKGVVFEDINTDENQTRVSNNSIRSVPTVLIFVNGLEVERLIGGLPESTYIEKLDKYVR